jgi:hypothetical protein
MSKHNRTQSRPKALYRVKNWSEYDKAPVQRGSITIWLSDDFEKSWRYAGEKQRGGQPGGVFGGEEGGGWLGFNERASPCR